MAKIKKTTVATPIKNANQQKVYVHIAQDQAACNVNHVSERQNCRDNRLKKFICYCK